jgi:hypothetical protein
MRAHRIDGFVQIAGCAVKKMFAGCRAPEGVTVEVMAWHGTELNVSVEIIFLDNPSLHNLPRFYAIIGDGESLVIPQTGYFWICEGLT